MSAAMTPNERTLEVYEEHGATWAAQHAEASPVVRDWLCAAVAGLPELSRILEIGSASGRDARFLQELGYHPECSDAAASFVEALNASGIWARHLNLLTGSIGGPYDLIVANAVLVHFTRDDLRLALQKVAAALSPAGRFAFTLKEDEREHDGWIDSKLGHLGAPRYFQFWGEPGIRRELSAAGFPAAEVTHAALGDASWLQIVASRVAD